MEEQILLDKESAKQLIKRYLEHYFIPNRTPILEDLICELADEGVINVDWIEIY